MDYWMLVAEGEGPRNLETAIRPNQKQKKACISFKIIMGVDKMNGVILKLIPTQ